MNSIQLNSTPLNCTINNVKTQTNEFENVYTHPVYTIEVLNNTRGASRVKFGNAAIGGQIQVPDVHSFTMSQTKSRFGRVFLLFKLFFAVKVLKISFQIV